VLRDRSPNDLFIAVGIPSVIVRSTFFCHREERSDEAISLPLALDVEGKGLYFSLFFEERTFHPHPSLSLAWGVKYKKFVERRSDPDRQFRRF